MKITIIGCGYVGLTTGAALAYTGHRVHCIDMEAAKLEALNAGRVPIHELGLPELIKETRGRLSFGDWDSFDGEADVVIIAVGTPRKSNGDADVSYVEAVSEELGRRLSGDRLPIIVNKSTVPIGSARRAEVLITRGLRNRGIDGNPLVASNPEFLREGMALFDTFYPDRIAIGAAEPHAFEVLREMYRPILEQTFVPPQFLPRPEGFALPSLVTTNPTSAELIKYAANTFLAMKISFIGEVAGLAGLVGADIKEIARGIGLDRRIGPQYLNAGVGWGGSCFGKDIQALLHMAGQYEYEMPLCRASIDANQRQREEVVRKLQSALKVIRGHTVGLLGLAFKPDTDDIRDAPAITIARRLIECGASVKAYDPQAMDNTRRIHSELEVSYVGSPEELFQDSDAVVLVTEWKEFLHLPFERLGDLMRQKVFIDGRNALDADEMRARGFIYMGIGR